jgi:hypothetical protein
VHLENLPDDSEPTMQKLAKFMLDPEAPNATSTLINGVSIIIDIIRHNNSDLENDPAVAALYDYQSNPNLRVNGSVSLAEMLKVMGDHVPEFTHLLVKPRSVNGPIRTTLGELEPLGFERLKICELFAELLHCSNMSNLNNSFNLTQEEEAQLADTEKENTTAAAIENKPKEPELSVGDYLKSKFVDYRAMPICVVSYAIPRPI